VCAVGDLVKKENNNQKKHARVYVLCCDAHRSLKEKRRKSYRVLCAYIIRLPKSDRGVIGQWRPTRWIFVRTRAVFYVYQTHRQHFSRCEARVRDRNDFVSAFPVSDLRDSKTSYRSASLKHLVNYVLLNE